MSCYTIRLTASAMRDLVKLPEKVASAIYEFLAGPLRDDPHRVGKALVGDSLGLYSARRGVYRIVYRIFEQVVEVEVTRIQHRRDV